MARTAVVAGVGPGLGASLARKFHAEGCELGLFARSSGFIGELADELGPRVLAVPTDVSDPDAVADGFESVREAFGPVDVLVVNASAAAWKGTLDVSHEEFDRALGVNVRGGLYCVQEAVPDMLEEGAAGDASGGSSDDRRASDGPGGTVIFTGATTATRGREGAIGFSAAKFAARGMAESMARELGPEGVHVAHVVVDGGILPPGRDVENPEAYLDPDEIAENYWHLVEQEESAWTLELDLRPHVEEF